MTPLYPISTVDLLSGQKITYMKVTIELVRVIYGLFNFTLILTVRYIIWNLMFEYVLKIDAKELRYIQFNKLIFYGWLGLIMNDSIILKCLFEYQDHKVKFEV